MHRILAAASLVGALTLSAPGQASETGDRIAASLYAGTLTDGRAALAPLARDGDAEARFGLGLIELVEAAEGFAQALHRYGLASPETGAMGPVIAVPVPVNPNPDPLDYDKVRDVLEALVTKLDEATADFLAAGESGDYVVLIDPVRIRIDANGDGVAEAGETIGQLFLRGLGIPDAANTRPTTPPPRNGRSQAPDASGADAAPGMSVGFDRADAIWLAGYSQVLAAQADFLLAHDFSTFVDATFHRLFPRAGLPMQDYVAGGSLVLDPDTDTAIADFIAAIHTLNWPVAEPDRLKRVLQRARSVIDYSRRNWDAILAETDDDRELVPNPSQTAIVPDAEVTEEIVAAWRETLDVAEQILEGELLVPHWRFQRGSNLRTYFETATRTDLVMLLTGYGALPYIEDGPVANADSFAAANRVFGNDILGYVFWFN